MKNAKFMLQIHRYLAAVGITEIRRYAEVMEALLNREGAEIGRKLEARALDFPEDVREEFYEYNSEHYQELVWHFPNQFRMSLVSTAYTMLEERVVNVAKTLETIRKSKVTLTDFKGDAYSRARLYLAKIIELPLNDEDWQPLDPFNFVRNVVVHNAGQIDKSHKRYPAVQQHIALNGHISADHLDNLILTEGYVEAYLNEIENFFSRLFGAWEKWATIRAVEA